jgi:hypothetical protein
VIPGETDFSGGATAPADAVLAGGLADEVPADGAAGRATEGAVICTNGWFSCHNNTINILKKPAITAKETTGATHINPRGGRVETVVGATDAVVACETADAFAETAVSNANSFVGSVVNTDDAAERSAVPVMFRARELKVVAIPAPAGVPSKARIFGDSVAI